MARSYLQENRKGGLFDLYDGVHGECNLKILSNKSQAHSSLEATKQKETWFKSVLTALTVYSTKRASEYFNTNVWYRT